MASLKSHVRLFPFLNSALPCCDGTVGGEALLAAGGQQYPSTFATRALVAPVACDVCSL